ncbi:hypothetical protein [Raoultella planticola]|uniref:hypothetical protein n=1 Tax=Raoultella planticola TaxID=575 RepID=UPI0035A23356
MTITLQAVNELIQSLESAGEPSIREQKFLKLAKAYQQLAAENVEAKKIISECREYFIAGVMNRIRPTNEGYLHMICDTFADETPATDRIHAGIKADGVEEYADSFRHSASRIRELHGVTIRVHALLREARNADDFAKQLREEAK